MEEVDAQFVSLITSQESIYSVQDAQSVTQFVEQRNAAGPSLLAGNVRKNFLIDTSTPHGDVVISEASLMKPSLGWVTTYVTESIRRGLHEWSVKVEHQGETSDGSGLMLGIVPKTFSKYDSFISQGGGWCLSRAGKLYGHWRRVDNNTSVGSLTYGTGDRVVFQLDFDASRMSVRVGDRCIVGEISNLSSEVYPAVSLHYRHQHVRFEYHKVHDRTVKMKSWIDRCCFQSAVIYLPLTSIEQLRKLPLDHYVLHPSMTSSSSSATMANGDQDGGDGSTTMPAYRGEEHSAVSTGAGGAGAGGADALQLDSSSSVMRRTSKQQQHHLTLSEFPSAERVAQARLQVIVRALQAIRRYCKLERNATESYYMRLSDTAESLREQQQQVLSSSFSSSSSSGGSRIAVNLTSCSALLMAHVMSQMAASNVASVRPLLCGGAQSLCQYLWQQPLFALAESNGAAELHPSVLKLLSERINDVVITLETDGQQQQQSKPGGGVNNNNNNNNSCSSSSTTAFSITAEEVRLHELQLTIAIQRGSVASLLQEVNSMLRRHSDAASAASVSTTPGSRSVALSLDFVRWLAAVERTVRPRFYFHLPSAVLNDMSQSSSTASSSTNNSVSSSSNNSSRGGTVSRVMPLASFRDYLAKESSSSSSSRVMLSFTVDHAYLYAHFQKEGLTKWGLGSHGTTPRLYATASDPSSAFSSDESCSTSSIACTATCVLLHTDKLRNEGFAVAMYAKSLELLKVLQVQEVQRWPARGAASHITLFSAGGVVGFVASVLEVKDGDVASPTNASPTAAQPPSSPPLLVSNNNNNNGNGIAIAAVASPKSSIGCRQGGEKHIVALFASFPSTMLSGSPVTLHTKPPRMRDDTCLLLQKDTLVSLGDPSKVLHFVGGFATVEVWVRIFGRSNEEAVGATAASSTSSSSTAGGGATAKPLYAHGDRATTGEVFIEIALQEGSLCVKGGYRHETRGTSAVACFIPPGTASSFFHVALVYDGRWRLLFNGEHTNNVLKPPSPSLTLMLERPRMKWTLGGGCIAHVAELRLWGRARNANEIVRDLARPLRGDDNGLLAYFPLRELAGCTLYNYCVAATTGGSSSTTSPFIPHHSSKPQQHARVTTNFIRESVVDHPISLTRSSLLLNEDAQQQQQGPSCNPPAPAAVWWSPATAQPSTSAALSECSVVLVGKSILLLSPASNELQGGRLATVFDPLTGEDLHSDHLVPATSTAFHGWLCSDASEPSPLLWCLHPAGQHAVSTTLPESLGARELRHVAHNQSDSLVDELGLRRTALEAINSSSSNTTKVVYSSLEELSVWILSLLASTTQLTEALAAKDHFQSSSSSSNGGGGGEMSGGSSRPLMTPSAFAAQYGGNIPQQHRNLLFRPLELDAGVDVFCFAVKLLRSHFRPVQAANARRVVTLKDPPLSSFILDCVLAVLARQITAVLELKLDPRPLDLAIPLSSADSSSGNAYATTSTPSSDFMGEKDNNTMPSSPLSRNTDRDVAGAPKTPPTQAEDLRSGASPLMAVSHSMRQRVLSSMAPPASSPLVTSNTYEAIIMDGGVSMTTTTTTLPTSSSLGSQLLTLLCDLVNSEDPAVLPTSPRRAADLLRSGVLLFFPETTTRIRLLGEMLKATATANSNGGGGGGGGNTSGSRKPSVQALLGGVLEYFSSVQAVVNIPVTTMAEAALVGGAATEPTLASIASALMQDACQRCLAAVQQHAVPSSSSSVKFQSTIHQAALETLSMVQLFLLSAVERSMEEGDHNKRTASNTTNNNKGISNTSSNASVYLPMTPPPLPAAAATTSSPTAASSLASTPAAFMQQYPDPEATLREHYDMLFACMYTIFDGMTGCARKQLQQQQQNGQAACLSVDYPAMTSKPVPVSPPLQRDSSTSNSCSGVGVGGGGGVLDAFTNILRTSMLGNVTHTALSSIPLIITLATAPWMLDSLQRLAARIKELRELLDQCRPSRSSSDSDPILMHPLVELQRAISRQLCWLAAFMAASPRGTPAIRGASNGAMRGGSSGGGLIGANTPITSSPPLQLTPMSFGSSTPLSYTAGGRRGGGDPSKHDVVHTIAAALCSHPAFSGGLQSLLDDSLRSQYCFELLGRSKEWVAKMKPANVIDRAGGSAMSSVWEHVVVAVLHLSSLAVHRVPSLQRRLEIVAEVAVKCRPIRHALVELQQHSVVEEGGSDDHWSTTVLPQIGEFADTLLRTQSGQDRAMSTVTALRLVGLSSSRIGTLFRNASGNNNNNSESNRSNSKLQRRGLWLGAYRAVRKALLLQRIALHSHEAFSVECIVQLFRDLLSSSTTSNAAAESKSEEQHHGGTTEWIFPSSLDLHKELSLRSQLASTRVQGLRYLLSEMQSHNESMKCLDALRLIALRVAETRQHILEGTQGSPLGTLEDLKDLWYSVFRRSLELATNPTPTLTSENITSLPALGGGGGSSSGAVSIKEDQQSILLQSTLQLTNILTCLPWQGDDYVFFTSVGLVSQLFSHCSVFHSENSLKVESAVDRAHRTTIKERTRNQMRSTSASTVSGSTTNPNSSSDEPLKPLPMSIHEEAQAGCWIALRDMSLQCLELFPQDSQAHRHARLLFLEQICSALHAELRRCYLYMHHYYYPTQDRVCEQVTAICGLLAMIGRGGLAVASPAAGAAGGHDQQQPQQQPRGDKTKTKKIDTTNFPLKHSQELSVAAAYLMLISHSLSAGQGASSSSSSTSSSPSSVAGGAGGGNVVVEHCIRTAGVLLQQLSPSVADEHLRRTIEELIAVSATHSSEAVQVARAIAGSEYATVHLLLHIAMRSSATSGAVLSETGHFSGISSAALTALNDLCLLPQWANPANSLIPRAIKELTTATQIHEQSIEARRDASWLTLITTFALCGVDGAEALQPGAKVRYLIDPELRISEAGYVVECCPSTQSVFVIPANHCDIRSNEHEVSIDNLRCAHRDYQPRFPIADGQGQWHDQLTPSPFSARRLPSMTFLVRFIVPALRLALHHWSALCSNTLITSAVQLWLRTLSMILKHDAVTCRTLSEDGLLQRLYDCLVSRRSVTNPLPLIHLQEIFHMVLPLHIKQFCLPSSSSSGGGAGTSTGGMFLRGIASAAQQLHHHSLTALLSGTNSTTATGLDLNMTPEGSDMLPVASSSSTTSFQRATNYKLAAQAVVAAAVGMHIPHPSFGVVSSSSLAFGQDPDQQQQLQRGVDEDQRLWATPSSILLTRNSGGVRCSLARPLPSLRQGITVELSFCVHDMSSVPQLGEPFPMPVMWTGGSGSRGGAAAAAAVKQPATSSSSSSSYSLFSFVRAHGGDDPSKAIEFVLVNDMLQMHVFSDNDSIDGAAAAAAGGGWRTNKELLTNGSDGGAVISDGDDAPTMDENDDLDEDEEQEDDDGDDDDASSTHLSSDEDAVVVPPRSSVLGGDGVAALPATSIFSTTSHHSTHPASSSSSGEVVQTITLMSFPIAECLERWTRLAFVLHHHEVHVYHDGELATIHSLVEPIAPRLSQRLPQCSVHLGFTSPPLQQQPRQEDDRAVVVLSSRPLIHPISFRHLRLWATALPKQILRSLQDTMTADATMPNSKLHPELQLRFQDGTGTIARSDYNSPDACGTLEGELRWAPMLPLPTTTSATMTLELDLEHARMLQQQQQHDSAAAAAAATSTMPASSVLLQPNSSHIGSGVTDCITSILPSPSDVHEWWCSNCPAEDVEERLLDFSIPRKELYAHYSALDAQSLNHVTAHMAWSLCGHYARRCILNCMDTVLSARGSVVLANCSSTKSKSTKKTADKTSTKRAPSPPITMNSPPPFDVRGILGRRDVVAPLANLLRFSTAAELPKRYVIVALRYLEVCTSLYLEECAQDALLVKDLARAYLREALSAIAVEHETFDVEIPYTALGAGVECQVCPMAFLNGGNGSVTFEASRSMEYLFVFGDKQQKLSLAKLPDAHGFWTDFEIGPGAALSAAAASASSSASSSSWLFMKPSTSLKTSPARFRVKLHSHQPTIGYYALQLLYDMVASHPNSVVTSALCSTVLDQRVLTLFANGIRTTRGTRRLGHMSTMTKMLMLWQRFPSSQLFDQCPLHFLLDRIHQFVHYTERRNALHPASLFMVAGIAAYPAVVRRAMELLVAAMQATSAWEGCSDATALVRRAWKHHAELRDQAVAVVPPPSSIPSSLRGGVVAPTSNVTAVSSATTCVGGGAPVTPLLSTLPGVTNSSGSPPVSPSVEDEVIPVRISSASSSSSISITTAASGISCRRRGRGVWFVTCDRGWQSVKSNIGFTRGKWYFEARVPSNSGAIAVGVVTNQYRGVMEGGGLSSLSSSSSSSSLGHCINSWGFDGGRLCRWHNGVRNEFSDRSKWKARDVVGILLDLENGSLSCAHNGKLVSVAYENLLLSSSSSSSTPPAGVVDAGGSGDPATTSSEPRIFYPAISFTTGGCDINFGASPFLFDLPHGFLPVDGRCFALVSRSSTAVVLHSLVVADITKKIAAAAAAATTNDDDETGVRSTNQKCIHIPASLFQQHEEGGGLDDDRLIVAPGRHGARNVSFLQPDGRRRSFDSEVRTGDVPCFVRSNVSVSSGKWYFELCVLGDGQFQLGWVSHQFSQKTIGDDPFSWAIDGCRMLAKHNKHQRSLGRHPWRDGDVLGCFINLDDGDGHIGFTINGVPLRDLHDATGDGTMFQNVKATAAAAAAATATAPGLTSPVVPTPFSSSSVGGVAGSSSAFVAFSPVIFLEANVTVQVMTNASEMSYLPSKNYRALGAGDTLDARLLNTYITAGNRRSSSSAAPLLTAVPINQVIAFSESIGKVHDLSSVARMNTSTAEIVLAHQAALQSLLPAVVTGSLGDSDSIGVAHRGGDDEKERAVSSTLPTNVISFPALVALTNIFEDLLESVARVAVPWDEPIVLKCRSNRAAEEEGLTSSSPPSPLSLSEAVQVMTSVSCPSLALQQLHLYLTSTHRPHAEYMKLTINRRRAMAISRDISEDKKHIPLMEKLTNTVFGQLFQLVGRKPASIFSSGKKLWAVVFAGEGADDVGGPYRETLTELCSELMRPGTLELFVPTPNQQNNVGAVRDRFTIQPTPRSPISPLHYLFIGRLLGGCLRSGEPLPLYFPSFFWKRLIGTPLLNSDFADVDSATHQSLSLLARDLREQEEEGESGEEDEDQQVYNGTFVITDTNGSTVVPFEGAATVSVSCENVHAFADMVRHHRLCEEGNSYGWECILHGFLQVVPRCAIRGLRWYELEQLVCGLADFDVDYLIRSARYDGLSPSDRRVVFLQKTLKQFSRLERALFVRFVSGRERLPTGLRLKLQASPSSSPDTYDDEHLPHASTCFYWLSLPNYSSEEVLRSKLSFAIHQCLDIDTDFRVRPTTDLDGGGGGEGDDGDQQLQQPAMVVREAEDDEDEFEDYRHLQ